MAHKVLLYLMDLYQNLCQLTRKYTYSYCVSEELDSAYSLEWYYGSEVFYRFRPKFNDTSLFFALVLQ